MSHYEVLISDKALEDMNAIYDHIVEILLAPDTAARQYDRISNAILSLEEYPERIRIMDTEPEHTKDLRQMTVDNFAIFFVINAGTIYITNVLYSASDISKRLSLE